MKTNSFAFNLMVPGQDHKDIVYNESILTIDQFLNNSITNFISAVPEVLEVGKKFILTEGDNLNQICFRSHESKEVQYLLPIQGMIIFVTNRLCFFLFNDGEWIKTNMGVNKIPENFSGINGEYTIPIDVANHYLCLSVNSSIIVEETLLPELTITIKQNHENSFLLAWPDTILWENNEAHVMTEANNSMDVVKLFRIPETHHFLGKIISQNHQF